MIWVVLMKINYKISLYSLYLKTIKRQYIYSSIEDSEVVPVFDHLKKLSSFCLNRQATQSAFLSAMCVLKYVLNCEQHFSFFVFPSGLTVTGLAKVYYICVLFYGVAVSCKLSTNRTVRPAVTVSAVGSSVAPPLPRCWTQNVSQHSRTDVPRDRTAGQLGRSVHAELVALSLHISDLRPVFRTGVCPAFLITPGKCLEHISN
jgi:hypothetical protein